MLRRLERHQGLVEPGGFPDHFAGAPVPGMACEGVGKMVAADVVGVLPRIAAADRRSEETEAQQIVGRLVPAVLVLRQDRHAVTALAVGKVRPLLAVDFVAVRLGVGPLNRAEAQIERRHGV